MTDLALQPLHVGRDHFANWIRIVAVTVTVAALLTLSFVLGRVTMSNTTHTIVRPVTVQSVNHPAGPAPIECHAYRPC